MGMRKGLNIGWTLGKKIGVRLCKSIRASADHVMDQDHFMDGKQNYYIPAKKRLANFLEK